MHPEDGWRLTAPSFIHVDAELEAMQWDSTKAQHCSRIPSLVVKAAPERVTSPLD